MASSKLAVLALLGMLALAAAAEVEPQKKVRCLEHAEACPGRGSSLWALNHPLDAVS
jgi:hypothetical protein